LALPPRARQPAGRRLDDLPKSEQVDNTPYFEMLVALGQKKKSGIERAIFDKGSLAWLSGAPQEIADNWRAKVELHRDELRAARQ
jgi:hypothetical protein